MPFCPYKQVFRNFTQCEVKFINEPAGNKKSADKNIHASLKRNGLLQLLLHNLDVRDQFHLIAYNHATRGEARELIGATLLLAS